MTSENDFLKDKPEFVHHCIIKELVEVWNFKDVTLKPAIRHTSLFPKMPYLSQLIGLTEKRLQNEVTPKTLPKRVVPFSSLDMMDYFN